MLSILGTVFSIGFYSDQFLKKIYAKDATTKMELAKERLIFDINTAKLSVINTVAQILDENALASLHLINNYQDHNNYDALLLDTEKEAILEEMLERIQLSNNSDITLYGQDEELIAFILLEPQGYNLNYIAFSKGEAIVRSKNAHETHYKEFKLSHAKDNPSFTYKHIPFYTQPQLAAGSIETLHYVNNKLYIKTHLSHIEPATQITTAHLEVSKIVDQTHLTELLADLSVVPIISDISLYSSATLPLMSPDGISYSNLIETQNSYFTPFSLDTKNGPVYITLNLDKTELNQTLTTNRNQLALFLAIICIAGLVIFQLFFKLNFTRPFNLLMRQISRVEKGHYEPVESVHSGDELEEISSSIKKLANTVQKRELQLKNSESNLAYLSVHDDLTGLINRRDFNVRLQKALTQAKKSQKSLALLFIDLDEFKQINDTLGHEIGDGLLIEVAKRIDVLTHQPGLVQPPQLARIGGDEFNIIIENIAHPNQANLFAEKIIETLTPAIQVQDNVINISASIGIAIFPQHGTDANSLLKSADLAMYHAKGQGAGHHYKLFNEILSEQYHHRSKILSALKLAVQKLQHNQSEFVLLYQPKISLSTQKIVGAEALIRWNSEQLGFVNPADFIAIAEESHMIIEIGEWVLNQACADYIALAKTGYCMQKISVNVSNIQLKHSNFLETVNQCIENTQIAPTSLELEVTESYIATNEKRAINTLAQFRAMGIDLAIDDFGTGYSSISYLQKLPMTRLKIDRSFVEGLPDSPPHIAMSNAIIALAKAFNLKITIEGIETQEQLAFFQDKYCDDVQGYVYSKPIGLEDMKTFIDQYR